MVLVIMGVSGCGKSTVAGLIAERDGWESADGDDFHSPANVAKMSAGQSLDDADRWPWLAAVAGWIGQRVESGQPGVIACSALAKRHRDRLRGDRVRFAYLAVDRERIAMRLAGRRGHYMPASLLDSQFATLEPPTSDEPDVFTVPADASPAQLVREIVAWLASAGHI